MLAMEDPESFCITLEKENELHKAFHNHPEADGEGRVPINKIADLFWNAGYILGTEHVKQFEEEVTENHGSAVSYDEAKPIFTEVMIKKLNVDFFKNLFRILDKNKQGIIPAENLKKILSQLPDTDEEEVDAMIEAIDDDGNGEVSFDEFYSLMCDE